MSASKAPQQRVGWVEARSFHRRRLCTTTGRVVTHLRMPPGDGLRRSSSTHPTHCRQAVQGSESRIITLAKHAKENRCLPLIFACLASWRESSCHLPARCAEVSAGTVRPMGRERQKARGCCHPRAFFTQPVTDQEQPPPCVALELQPPQPPPLSAGFRLLNTKLALPWP